MTRRILIVGGYGTFGGRLARLLMDDERLTLLIAGRSLTSAEHFCASLEARATLLAGCVRSRWRPRTASSPRLSRYSRRLHRAFPVLWRRCLPAGGVRASRFASTTSISPTAPASSKASVISIQCQGKFGLCAVGRQQLSRADCGRLRKLALGMTAIDSVTGGIAPSPYAGVGLNVIRAIAGYAGQPVTMIKDGAPAIGHGLTEAMRYTIRAAQASFRCGAPAFRSSMCQTCSLSRSIIRMLKILVDGRRARAGNPASHAERTGWLTRLKLAPSLSYFAPLFSWAINHVRLGRTSRRYVRLCLRKECRRTIGCTLMAPARGRR